MPDSLATRATLRSPLARRLLGESVLYGLAGALAKALALVTVPFLTRQLAPSGYGLADLATSLAALVTLVVTFAGDIPTARLRGLAPDRERARAALRMYVVMTAVVSASVTMLILPASGLIAQRLWASPGSNGLAALSLVLVPISAVQAALVNVQRLESRARTYAVLSTIDFVAQLGGAVGLVALGWGPEGVVVGFIGGSVVGLIAAAWKARTLWEPRLDWSVGRRILQEGLPFLPAIVLFAFADSVSRVLAANVLGVASVGYLGAAVRLASVMTLVTMAFSAAWGPYALALPHSQRTTNLVARVLLWYGIVMATAAIGAGAVAAETVGVISGTAYAPAGVVLPGLLLAAGMAGAYYVLLVAAGIAERSFAVAWSSTGGALAQIALTVVLLPPMGLPAVGVAAVGGRGLSLLLLALGLRPLLPLGYRRFGLVMLAAAAATIALQALNERPESTVLWRGSILISIVLGLIVFLARTGPFTRFSKSA